MKTLFRNMNLFCRVVHYMPCSSVILRPCLRAEWHSGTGLGLLQVKGRSPGPETPFSWRESIECHALIPGLSPVL